MQGSNHSPLYSVRSFELFLLFKKQENFMCGRYSVNNETSREIERLIQRMDQRMKYESVMAAKKIVSRDIYPAQEAPVLEGREGSVRCGWQRWGFAGPWGNKVIFNARCETVMEKPLFCDSILHRRIVIPASWFYEWNVRKEKTTFYRKTHQVLFMAGFCRHYEDGKHFVILTTQANASVKPVHDRMPLILEEDEITRWILDDKGTWQLLHKTPCLLENKTDYEQLTLF